MIELKAINLHWISEEETERDLCAHGQVLLKIGDRLVSDEKAGDWTVSGAAYNLLTTLQYDYINGSSYQWIPCCGHDLFFDEETEHITVLGCPYGIEWKITCQNNKVIHTFFDGEIIETDRVDWARAIGAFSDQVMNFYQESKTKEPREEDREVYKRFIEEWQEKREEVGRLMNDR
jgi:hypothetical protein